MGFPISGRGSERGILFKGGIAFWGEYHSGPCLMHHTVKNVPSFKYNQGHQGRKLGEELFCGKSEMTS